MGHSKRTQHGGVIFWALIVLIGAAVGAVVAFELVLKRVQARLLVTDAPLTAYVDQSMPVSATVLNELKVTIDDTVRTAVPVDTTLSVPVEEALDLVADFDALVPVSLVVPVNDVIPLEQEIDIDTVVEADLLGETFKLPMRGRFPVKANVPVKLLVPVEQELRLKFTAPIKARLKQNLIVPLNTTIEADIPLRTEMSVPVLNNVQIEVDIQKSPALPVTLNYSDLKMPLGTLGFSFVDNSNQDSGSTSPPQSGETDNQANNRSSSAEEVDSQ